MGVPETNDSDNYPSPPLARFALPEGILDAILKRPGQPSQAFIVTDPNGDQRTYFAPGSRTSDTAWTAHLLRVSQKNTLQNTVADWVIQAPLEPTLMLEGLNWAKSHGATTVWSPGQYCSMLSEPQIAAGLAASDYLITNRNESEIFTHAVRSQPALYQVISNGSEPIVLMRGNYRSEQAVPEATVIDPTGCGDAFVAGFVDLVAGVGKNPALTDIHHAIAHGVACAQACLSKIGCQNHSLTLG